MGIASTPWKKRCRLCFKERAGVSIHSCIYKNVFKIMKSMQNPQQIIHKIRLQTPPPPNNSCVSTSDKVLSGYHLLGLLIFKSTLNIIALQLCSINQYLATIIM